MCTPCELWVLCVAEELRVLVREADWEKLDVSAVKGWIPLFCEVEGDLDSNVDCDLSKLYESDVVWLSKVLLEVDLDFSGMKV